MLWESTDPRSALRERFGLDSFDDAVSWLTEAVARSWAIDVHACERILISDRNAIAWVSTDRGALVVKWSCAEDQFVRLAAIAELLGALDRQGVPVAPPLASVDGRYRLIVGSGSLPLSMTVLPQIAGELLDTADEAAVRAAGACLASLHGALAIHRDSRLVEGTRYRHVDLRQRIESWLESGDAGTAPAASARLREQLASLPPIDSEPQLIHNDYRASNILTGRTETGRSPTGGPEPGGPPTGGPETGGAQTGDPQTGGTEIRAVVDFDEVARDHRVSDLANSFVLLGTHFTDWQPTPASVRATFLEGYQSVRPLTELEHQWLQALVLWRGITAIPAGEDPAGWADAL